MKQILAILCVIALTFCCAAVCVVAAPALAGDANNDGVIDMKDVLTIRKYVAEFPVSVDVEKADANGDGNVNTKDVLWLRKYIAELDPTAKITTRPPAGTTASAVSTLPRLPSADVELRGVWLAYYEVAALLKSTPNATKAAIDAAFDQCKTFGINTVFFHVRAYSDAYYASSIFPQVPAAKALIEKGFDPLTYAVSAAHERGMALHAWINPYRVGKAENAVCGDTFTCDGKVYYNPASEAVQKTLLAGIEELLKRYDIDGIHLDDYFYPSGIPTVPQPFDVGYSSAKGSLGDWRRAQVTDFVKKAFALTHSLSETAVFGISPAGNIQTDRDELYADVETWLKTAGCVDYLCPQIYYGFKNGSAPFSDTVTKWASLPRAKDVRLYVGLSVYKAGLLSDTWAGSGKTEWAAGGNILARQVTDLRERNNVSGFVLFSFRYMTGDAFDDTCDKAVALQELSNLRHAITA